MIPTGDVDMIDTAAHELRELIQGAVFEPGDVGYVDACTLFNAVIERRPAMVVRPTSAADVAEAIRFARRHDLPLAVRSGGHSAAGWSLCDGGVVLDMRSIDTINVDPEARTAKVGGGCMTGAVDRACQAHGLATVTGRVSTTGIAGFTLGGGSGMLERRFGFAVDNLLAVDMVTADGALITADHETHSDLFWALRGGGGNFGVVTSLTFQLHPIEPVVTGGLLLHHADRGVELLHHLRSVMETAPEHLGVFMFYLYAPDDPAIPEDLRNKLAAGLMISHSGPPGSAEKELAALRAFGPPAADFVEETTWADLQCSIDDPPGYRNYMTSDHLIDLTDDAVNVIDRYAHKLPRGPGWVVVFCWGGAVNRPPSPTPLNRDARWVVHPGAFWEDPTEDDTVRAWVRSFRSELRPHTTGSVWLNWVGDEGDARVRSAFGDDAYRTLQAVKEAYDPQNVFRSNHNIAPSP
jgi:FAD/FMN-containing dehydrogenase